MIFLCHIQIELRIIFHFCSAIITGGGEEGRLTDITNIRPDITITHDDEFRDFCCVRRGGCNRYLDKRPVIGFEDVDITFCKC